MVIFTLPLSTNSLYRGRRFNTKEGVANKSAMGWEMKNQWGKKPLTGPVRLKIALWRKDNRRFDIDNIKGLLDAFSGILYEDDSQIVELHLFKGVDKKNPRVEISLLSKIEELKEGKVL